MNKMVVGNQKMIMNFSDVSAFVSKVKGKINNDNVVVCPTSLYIPYYINNGFSLGVQNDFYENSGSYTGELSPLQIKEAGINYVIVGHSERRKYLNELESMINKKVKSNLDAGLNTILCIGETLEEKSNMKTKLALRRQIYSALSSVIKLDNLIIAYEPVWSIGTNKLPSKEEIEENVMYIKNLVKQYTGYDNIRVIYGGSINSKNISVINQISILDGVLVGKASTEAEEFLKIKEVVVGQ